MKPNASLNHSMRNVPRIRWFFLCLALLSCFIQSAIADNRTVSIKKTLDTLLSSKQHPLLQQTDFSGQMKDLLQLYRPNFRQLIWIGEGRSEKNLNDAIDILNNAASDGLNPRNYDAEQLKQSLQQLKVLPQNDYQQMASYDLAISISLLKFLHDLHSGQIDPHSFNYPLPFGSTLPFNVVALLKTHLDHLSVNELPQIVAPKTKQYQLLKEALASYRQQIDSEQHYKLSFPKSIKPGEMDIQIPALRRRLREMGELTAQQAEVTGVLELVYDDVSAAAIIRLQQQQGLQADGVIGRQTLLLLNQTINEKIALIELAMERMRWLPELPAGPQIFVNIPAFQLWAFNSPDDQNAINMKVVVGKAEENQTPVLWQEMKYLEFMPYWNIPRSIMDKEIVPKMQAGRNYLSTQEIELVERISNEDSEEADNIVEDLRYGRIRARQLPGKKNPLGKVKFIFPNKDDVYLHDTPFRYAFNRDRRDLSHGCVRVADAEKLAEFVLGVQQGWDKKAIEQAMAGPKTQRVSLKKSIPVLFYYSTAYAGQDNKLRFYPDIYGYDVVLKNAIDKTANKIVVVKSTTVDG